MEEQEYRPFHDTYRIITFFLCIGLIYPNPKTDKIRLVAIFVVISSIAPIAIMILIDMYKSWQENDIINIIRHSTVMGPFLAGFLKMLLMYHTKTQAKHLMDEISRDFIMFNEFSQKYKDIANAWIRNSQVYSELAWLITVTFCVMTFPFMAIMETFYNYIFKDDPVKLMIHDLRKPYSETEEEKLESPYFEVMFVYMMYCSILYVVNFTGYDGFFGLAINHACLKMDLYCTALEEAFKSDDEELHWRVVAVIKEQCRMYEFVGIIQETFNIWLGLIFIATTIQICTCMYHITEGYGLDLRYLVFVIGAIIHIYLPCRYAAKLKALTAVTADRIYSSGWEQVKNQPVRKMIVFMIARAQVPNEITAFGMLAFNMELFVSIMQSSYSMFTLLRS